MVIDALRHEAQAVLGELLRKGKLYYKLLVRELTRENDSQFTVHFQGHRTRSMTVTREVGWSFKEVVRDAVINGYERRGGHRN